MNHVLFLTVLLFFTTQITAQNDLLNKTGKSDYDKIDYKLLDETIWVRDSIYYYSDNGSGWLLYKKEIVTSRDDKGRMTSKISYLVNSTGEITNDVMTKVGYYSNDILNDSLVVKWNEGSQSWQDTIHYIKNDVKGNVLIKYISKDEINSTGTPVRVKMKHTYSYNDFSKKIYHLYQYSQDDNEWEKRSESFFKYNQKQLLIDIIQHFFSYLNDDVPIPESFYHYIYEYDNANNILSKIEQKKKQDNEEWRNAYKFTYSYSINGILEGEEWMRWNAGDAKWISLYLGHYEYQDSLLVKRLWKRWKQDSLMLWSQTVYQYDSAARLIDELYQHWNNNKMEWVDIDEYLYKFDQYDNLLLYSLLKYGKKKRMSSYKYDDEQRLIEFLYKIGNDDNEWVNHDKLLIDYYNDKKININYLWNETDSLWIEKYTHTDYFDENGNLVKRTEIPNPDIDDKEKLKIIYFWSKFELSKTELLVKDKISIYPNPAGNYLMINNLNANTSIKIYSISGVLLKTMQIQNGDKIDISDLEQGIYFLHIGTHNKKYKFVISK